MADSELGKKHTCVSCSARFYDLNKDPAVCPKCGAEQRPELVKPARRGRAAAVVVEEPVAEVETEAEDLETEEAEDESMIEDASDLGEDDVSEVIGDVDDDGEEET